MKLCYPILLLFLLGGCQSTSNEDNRNLPVENPLEGKWRLVSSMQEPQTSQQAPADSISYHKVLTTNNFTWIIYSKTSGELIATAGGSYSLEGEKYTEYLDYIYPHDAALLSSSIPFLCQIEGNRWIHSGYIEVREYDSLINDYVSLSKYKLEEIWERVE